jgi:hypothetical protein
MVLQEVHGGGFSAKSEAGTSHRLTGFKPFPAQAVRASPSNDVMSDVIEKRLIEALEKPGGARRRRTLSRPRSDDEAAAPGEHYPGPSHALGRLSGPCRATRAQAKASLKIAIDDPDVFVEPVCPPGGGVESGENMLTRGPEKCNRTICYDSN